MRAGPPVVETTARAGLAVERAVKRTALPSGAITGWSPPWLPPASRRAPEPSSFATQIDGRDEFGPFSNVIVAFAGEAAMSAAAIAAAAIAQMPVRAGPGREPVSLMRTYLRIRGRTASLSPRPGSQSAVLLRDQRRLRASLDLLDCPRVAVGILEAEEGPAVGLGDHRQVTHLSAAVEELLPCGFSVRHHELESLQRPGVHFV